METQFRSSFVRDLDRLSEKSLKQRIKAVIAEVENAASLRDIANLKKLQGGQDYYRIRVGDYRIGLVCQQGTGNGDSPLFRSSGCVFAIT